MYALIHNDPEFFAVAPEVIKAARRGQFWQAYAQLYADVGLNADEYEAIGTTLQCAMRMKDGITKSRRLGRLAVWVSRHLGLNGRRSDDPRRQALVNTLFELAQRHDGSRYGEAPPPIVLVRYVIGAAEFALAAGLPFDADRLADVTHAAVKADRLPFSITDIRGTISAMRRHRSLIDWTCEEEIERLRPQAHESLVALLRSPEAPEWLAGIMRSPELAKWVVGQMRTPEERALLLNCLRQLQKKAA